MHYYAHSLPGRPEPEWQPLETHLKNVAEKAAEFAEPFGASAMAYLAGLYHDLGKFAPDFQHYLRTSAEASDESRAGSVDHSTAGAKAAIEKIGLLGHILAYAIAGHHSGLLDGRSLSRSQEKRLNKKIPDGWQRGLEILRPSREPEIPAWLRGALGQHDAFAAAFFTRMIFSCLVDADFLDTEAFMDRDRASYRSPLPTLNELASRFFKNLQLMEEKAQGEPLANLRKEIRLQCESASAWEPGFFSLTVPTGGGKTLSSMAFALRHGIRWKMGGIIYVLPYTTIIEQNAAVFRKFLGPQAVLEHHSNLDPRKETLRARLASENWSAPLIVTTTVQFYESLFANRPSDCRKLHRLARSIVVLDEAQSLPVDYLAPCLRALRELVTHYGATVVLCTATQPAIQHRPDFPIGLENVREIISNPSSLYRRLKRVETEIAGQLTDDELSCRILAEHQVLCIVNTTRHARLLYERIGSQAGHFHLSARMCPAHRRVRLRQIRRALEKGATCRVISTTVVEAGIDVDFPVVYRAMSGLDSIAQAAGRCNRHNRMPRLGRLIIFKSEHPSANQFVADTANVTSQVLALKPTNPLDLKTIEQYFKLYYWDQSPRWDSRRILEGYNLEQDRHLPFNFQFETISNRFHLVDEAESCVLIIPWMRRGRKVAESIRRAGELYRSLLRKAQSFSVAIPRAQWLRLATSGDVLPLDERTGVLESVAVHYDENVGLKLEVQEAGGFYV